MAGGSIHSSPCAASGRVRQNGDAIANGWTAEQMSWTKPGSVSSADRTPPPISGFRLEHHDLASGLRKDDGRAQTVRPRTDDDRINHAL